MTAAQVFLWFCKEQHIYHYIIKMFFLIQEMHNKHSIYREPEKMTLEGYINKYVYKRGFYDMLDKFITDYSVNYYCKNHDKSDITYEMFNNVENKWKYFITHNIHIDENTLKLKDKVLLSPYRNYNFNGEERPTIEEVVIDEIDLSNSRVNAHVNNGESYLDLRRYVPISDIIDCETREKKKISYYIKRKRKSYYGANKR